MLGFGFGSEGGRLVDGRVVIVVVGKERGRVCGCCNVFWRVKREGIVVACQGVLRTGCLALFLLFLLLLVLPLLILWMLRLLPHSSPYRLQVSRWTTILCR